MFSAKVREKSIEMTKHMRVLRFFLVAVMVIILAAAAPKVWAEDNGEEIPFEEAKSISFLSGLSQPECRGQQFSRDAKFVGLQQLYSVPRCLTML